MNLLVPSHRKDSSSHGSSPYKEIQRQTGIHGRIHGDIHTKRYTHTHTPRIKETPPQNHTYTQRHTPSLLGEKREPHGFVCSKAVFHTLLLTPTDVAKPLPRLRGETPHSGCPAGMSYIGGHIGLQASSCLPKRGLALWVHVQGFLLYQKRGTQFHSLVF